MSDATLLRVAAPGGRRRRLKTSPQTVAMLLPGLAVLAIFFGLPVLDLVRTSLSSWSGIGPREWTGVDNFAEVFSDATIRSALVRSIVMGVGVALGIAALGTVLAAFVSRGLAGSRIYRVLWFLPGVAPPTAVAVFWALSVQPFAGVVNVVLGGVGLGDDHAWLADPSTALIVIIAVGIWQGVGFAFLIILGAMEEVPVSVYEAAMIDGAGGVRSFFQITLPMIRPVLSTVVLLNVIWAFNGFTLVWGMTRGGPGDSTTILPVLVYKDAFESSNFGVAAAVSVVGGVFLLILGFAVYVFGSRKAPDA
ncbi:carbohydrate ABC transporter permease [Aeromicrobium sp. Root344]|uniref:carbohydrate ABC transporter permease n=1 Tax=Aeromicrobium sp. Root344 TaxID=1736521 RepID=UPI001910DD42|nr:sugar ABC transporter permease [Aeromicrobium sp. Root344]